MSSGEKEGATQYEKEEEIATNFHSTALQAALLETNLMLLTFTQLTLLTFTQLLFRQHCWKLGESAREEGSRSLMLACRSVCHC